MAGVSAAPLVADLEDLDELERIVREARPRFTFNLAGYGVDRSERDPRLARHINAHLPRRLAEVLLDDARSRTTGGDEAGPGLVHTGSALEYGVADKVGEADPTEPTTDYGRTKLEGTEAVSAAARKGLRALTARLFTVFGPGEHPGRLLPSLLEAVGTDHPIELTEGRQERDFTYIEDVVEGLVRLAQPLRTPTVVNLATGKMWGRDPKELSGIQARKRVTAGSFSKLIKRGLGSRGSYFYYPREGYGQISNSYARAAEELGADLRLGSRVTRLSPPSENDGRWLVESERDGQKHSQRADYVWSTIPITIVARMMDPAPPPEVLEAARAIDYRAMVLVYLELGVDQFTTTDAHYFPEEHICFTRLSEPKNYFGHSEPRGRTTLCAELPCERDDNVWNMGEEDLRDLVVGDIRKAELPLDGDPLAVHVRRLPQAYPIYLNGYEVPLGTLDAWTETLPGFLSYGRQGLFAHDNTHHALYMAYSAVDCIEGKDFNAAKWAEYRAIFKTHVVED